MERINKMDTNIKTARTAGVFWLLMIIFGPIAEVIRIQMFVNGDMTATANNIMENDFLYRVGFISEIIMMLCFILLLLVLYKLLCKISKDLSVLMVVFGLLGVAIGMMNLLNQYTSLYLLSGAENLKNFDLPQLQAQALMYHDMYLNGYEIANIFCALWVLPLGIIIYRSGMIPKIFGILMVIDFVCLMSGGLIYFLFPQFDSIINFILIPAVIAEFSMTAWLLIRGVSRKAGSTDAKPAI
jgi:hypothetical protein